MVTPYHFGLLKPHLDRDKLYVYKEETQCMLGTWGNCKGDTSINDTVISTNLNESQVRGDTNNTIV